MYLMKIFVILIVVGLTSCIADNHDLEERKTNLPSKFGNMSDPIERKQENKKDTILHHVEGEQVFRALANETDPDKKQMLYRELRFITKPDERIELFKKLYCQCNREIRIQMEKQLKLTNNPNEQKLLFETFYIKCYEADKRLVPLNENCLSDLRTAETSEEVVSETILDAASEPIEDVVTQPTGTVMPKNSFIQFTGAEIFYASSLGTFYRLYF